MATPIPEINYAGTPLSEKYQWMQTGPGVGGVEPAVGALARLSPQFEASDEHINQALRGTGVSWRGSAASAAAGSLGHIAHTARAAGQAGTRGGALVGDYSTSFAAAKTRIAAPVEQHWWSRFTDWAG